MSDAVIDIDGCAGDCDLGINLWVKDLLPRTPGAVRKVVRREVQLACREFFERSLAWRATVGPKDLKAGTRRVIMSPHDAYANVVRVLAVEIEGTPIRAYSRRPSGAEPTSMTRPMGYWMEEPDVVAFWPRNGTEALTKGVLFYVALTPKNCVTKLPRIAETHFYDAILDGALGRLYAHPAKPYSDTTKAQYHLNRFRAAIGIYAADAKSGFTTTPQWRFPRFGK